LVERIDKLVEAPQILKDLDVQESLCVCVKENKTVDFSKIPRARALPLFEQYPALKKTLPHVSLGSYPTPINEMKKLGKKLQLNSFFMKRDDQSGGILAGSNDLPFGGNKVRKLEFLFGDMLAHGIKEVIAVGDAGSNFALATAAYAKQLGIRSSSMLVPQKNAHYVRRNLLLSHYCDAKLYYYPTDELRDIMVVGKCWRNKQKGKEQPYVFPSGGSSPLGTIGFVNAVFELKEQINKGIMPEPDYIYVPFGSLGTVVGLLLGIQAAKLKTKVVGVSVCRQETLASGKDLFEHANKLLCDRDPSFPLCEFSKNEFEFNNNFLGDGYAQFTKEGADAITLLNESESILLEGTYSGKAFAALIDDVKKEKIKKDDIVLFWNTYCSEKFEDVIEGIDYKNLPPCFHFYFEEDVQLLDR
jgi:1-aminocyclopropane-1-carboxylate deaminase/D-cysteine desulfhydrase-like pyridoxal-dependent ACC family enzyme